LFLIAMYLGQARETLTHEQSMKLADQLLKLPAQLEEVLRREGVYEDLTKVLFRSSDFLYLGRGIHFPIALEGALKLKEISYIHAEGYPAGEMKHGPNALIDENLPTVVIATRDRDNELSNILYEKTLSNIQEVKARGGLVVAVACEGDEDVHKVADHVITVGSTNELLLPILEVVPLQMLAYHIAVRRGCDVDQPRNLAKSVTVE
jgi:glucosamine--fructose-6-phosphate aminotransferase (isomerizing)